MMSTKKYRIRLTTDEQQELNALVSRGRAAAYKQTHARILLMSDESRSDGGMKDADITSALGVGQSTVERIRKRCVEEGVESALNRKKQLRRRQKRLDGEGEARLIAMACGEPPEGRASWTLKLLADQLVECEIVGTISTETVRQALKKRELSGILPKRELALSGAVVYQFDSGSVFKAWERVGRPISERSVNRRPDVGLCPRPSVGAGYRPRLTGPLPLRGELVRQGLSASLRARSCCAPPFWPPLSHALNTRLNLAALDLV